MRLPIAFLLALALVQPLEAQLIPLKSTATPLGAQGLPLPSDHVGRAGIGVPGRDSLGDPFRNPALASPGATVRLGASPVLYGETQGTIGGTTVPVTALVRWGDWFGALAWGAQELDDDPRAVFAHPPRLASSARRDEERTNTWLLGSVGRRFATGTSVGVQVLRGDVGMLDGTRRLYPRSLSVVQDGEVGGLTVGLAHELEGERRIEATFGRSRVELENEVVRWRWSLPDGSTEQEAQAYTELDRDVSRTLEGRLRYTHPLESLGFRLGAAVGVRDRRQEETPRYDIVNIPRDPGSARTWEISMGGESFWQAPLLAWEVSFQPGSADTRAVADSTFATPGGRTVRPGEPAVDSHFRFRNWRVAGAAQAGVGPARLQLGLAAHRYSLALTQEDHLFETTRAREEAWTELVPSAGARVTLGPVDLGYAVTFTMRGKAPCVPHSFRTDCRGREETFWNTGLPVAPTDPANIPDFRVTTHHLTLSWRAVR